MKNHYKYIAAGLFLMIIITLVGFSAGFLFYGDKISDRLLKFRNRCSYALYQTGMEKINAQDTENDKFWSDFSNQLVSHAGGA